MRRATHADGRDVRERGYKPLMAPVWLVSTLAYIAAGRLWRPIERPHLFVTFVAFAPFVVQKIPFVSVAPFLL